MTRLNTHETAMIGGDGIPEALRDLQRTAEALYLSAKQQELRLLSAAAQPPEALRRPSPPGVVMRSLMRLLPFLAQAWQRRVLRRCGLFDAAWYLRRNADVAAAGGDPVRHFLTHGGREGRDPGPHFSTQHYLKLYPDVRESGRNPLIHYLISGIDEGRSAHPGMPENHL